MQLRTAENPRLAQLAGENMDYFDEEGWLTLQFGQSEVTLPYREISPGVRFVYRSGYCAFLALAIHELTGLPLAVFTIPGTGMNDWHGHVTVKTGEDEYLDIAGFSTEWQINENYGYGENTPHGALRLTVTDNVAEVPEIFHEDIRHNPWLMFGELERLVTEDYARQIIEDYLTD
jgi:hypothetical protein